MQNKPKIAIYTCITGNYDQLVSPNDMDNRLDYFCFSDDSKNVVSPWIFKSIDLPNLNNKDKQRYIKIHSHEFFPDYDFTIYIDGKVKIVGNIYEFFLSICHLPNYLSSFSHAERTCVYSEGAACSYFAHDWVWNIARQMRQFSSSGFPMNNGLMDTCVLVRKNTPETAVLMEAWWKAYCDGVKRDQLSISFISWKLAIPLTYLGQNNFEYFQVTKHLTDNQSLKRKLQKYVDRFITFVIPYQKLFSVPSAISRKKPFHSI